MPEVNEPAFDLFIVSITIYKILSFEDYFSK